MPDSGAGRRLELVAVGPVDAGLLAELGRELDRRFGTRSFRGPPLPLLDEWRDPGSGQYHSGSIVDALIARADALGTDGSRLWSLAVADVDLYAPDRTFVFGEATVGGCCAVIGLARLRPAGRDPALFRERVLAEAVHELGHVAGLDHCPDPGCVMHVSREAIDTDRKGTEFCSPCTDALARLVVNHAA